MYLIMLPWLTTIKQRWLCAGGSRYTELLSVKGAYRVVRVRSEGVGPNAGVGVATVRLEY